MSKTIVACVEDLFFRSKIEATARHLNVPVKFTDVAGLSGALEDGHAAALLLELSANGKMLDAVRKLREASPTRDLPIVGFLSHVDRQLARDAESAGVTRVMPRSQFSET
ncbi:MAG TPA: response regulator, partial [Thermoanaerobaculia bacterium]